MSYYRRLQETLKLAEERDDAFALDRTAFTLARANRAGIIHVEGARLVESLPKLKKQFDDCLAQDNTPLRRYEVLLSIANNIDDEDTHGRVCDLLRKIAND